MALQTIRVPSFGGHTVAFRRTTPNPLHPTVVLLHSFSTDGQLYEAQFGNEGLTKVCNLLAIDEFGHGGTAGLTAVLTYWDQARMVLEVMEALGVGAAFVLGTSQGGFIAARMALLEPEKVLGLVLCGASLYAETSAHGSWDINEIFKLALPILESTEPTPDFILPQPFTDDVILSGFGILASEHQKQQIRKLHEQVYVGDKGRQRYLMITKCLRDRDNLSSEQLGSIKCPILVCHGTGDIVYSVALMREWTKELSGAASLQVEVVEGGTHFLTASHPEKVDEFLLAFLNKSITSKM